MTKFVTPWMMMVLPLLLFLSPRSTQGEIICPPFTEIPYCSCFVLEDQLHIQCSGSDIAGLKKSLQVLNGPVKSYSVYDLDGRVLVLPDGVTDNVTSPVYHLQISHSSLEDLGEKSLLGLSKSLESLAIVSSKLKFIPHTTLRTLRRLKTLDLEANEIQELGPYSFHTILLQKLNLKGNLLENVSENAFWGLEETLLDLDLSENKLSSLPYQALRRLRLMRSLTLAWNSIEELDVLIPIPSPAVKIKKAAGAFDVLRHSLKTGLSSSSVNTLDNSIDYSVPPNPADMDWPLMHYLNLNSNNLRKLKRGTFLQMRNLKTLSIHLNSLEIIEPETFFPLTILESIDLSNNKLTALPPSTFQGNRLLQTIDLSNCHLHSISEGLLQNLPELREVFLNGNNILALSDPSSFLNSEKISIINLQGNSIRYIESGVFAPLRNLSEIRLSENFVRVLPQDLFMRNELLASVSLDSNLLSKLAPGTFQNCKHLRELRLQNNEITAIPSGVLEHVEWIETLYLENNKLSMIKGLSSLRRIRHLTLSRNSFEQLTPDLIPGMELSSLSLGYNAIQGIQDGVFGNQSTLSVLFLGHNSLRRLGPKAFSGLRSLERLYLQRNNISWIHDDCFNLNTPTLFYLDLSFNSLKTINRVVFSALAFIEEINLSNNHIRTIEEGSFTNLRSLKILSLSKNHIQVLHYSSTFYTGGLEILNLSFNPLSELYLSSSSTLITLRDLDLQDTLVTASVIRQLSMPRLEILQISGNNLTDLDEGMLEGFPSLNFFSAEGSHITALPTAMFKPNPNLQVIKLSENSINHIPDTLAIPPVTRELHLRGNRLRSFPYKALQGNNATALELLSLSGNRINTLDLNRIHLPSMKQLSMRDNRLTKIMGSFGKSMPLLTVADFGENNISRLNEDLVRNLSLTVLNFGGNILPKIPSAFSELLSPFVLNMSGNPLVNFYAENLHLQQNFSVMDLYLCDTNVSFLTSEHFKIYGGIRRLVIKRNPLTLLPPAAFSSLQNLNLLDLSENLIEDLKHDSFIGLRSLKSLNLSQNQIKDIEPFHQDLAGVQELDLSGNKITKLSAEIFSNLVSLVTLRLRQNWLTHLPDEMFGALSRLSLLDVSMNFIENLPPAVLRHLETRISNLRLEGNPLNCDCDSKELWEWLQSHPKLFYISGSPIVSALIGSHQGGGGGGRGDGTGINGMADGPLNLICERPEEFRGRNIADLDMESICSSPAIVKLAIQDVQPSSAVISWLGRNNSAMHGYMIGYHALNHDDQIRWTRPLPPVSKAYRLPDLESDTPYLVCVLGLGQDGSNGNVTTSALTVLSAETVLRDSPVSKCTKVRTSSPITAGGAFSLLQRRMGVIVGAAVGVIVFLVLMILLSCVKLRKRTSSTNTGNGNTRENGKIDHTTNNTNGKREVLTTTTTALNPGSPLGTLGGYHHHSNYQNYHTSTLTRMGNGNNGNSHSSPGHMSPPEFLSYRHYSINDNAAAAGIHGSVVTTTELDNRL